MTDVVSRLKQLHVTWSCSICGPSKKNRAMWCDLGCGSDYNRMDKLVDIERALPVIIELVEAAQENLQCWSECEGRDGIVRHHRHCLRGALDNLASALRDEYE